MDVNVAAYGMIDLFRNMIKLMSFSGSPEFRAILEDAGMTYVNRAKRDAPISRNPGATGLVNGGALRASIGYTINSFGTPMTNLVLTAGGKLAPYAPAVELGARSSMRIPVNRKVMFWAEDSLGRKILAPWSMMGQLGIGGMELHYRHIVWHPGTRPQPFFFKHALPIAERTVEAIRLAIQRMWS